MISFDESLNIINSINTSATLKAEKISAVSAADRVLYDDVTSGVDYPACDNSAMDGYAVNSDLTKNINSPPLILPIYKKVVYAGDTSVNYKYKKSPDENFAVRIMTGGYMPETFDAVIPLEDAVIENNNLIISSPVKQGKNVRNRGEVIKKGDIILKKNTRLTPENISLLVSCSITKIKVFEKIPVSVISTGNEIIGLDKKPAYGKIYNSNGILAENFLLQNGCVVANNAVCKDNFEEIAEVLSQTVKTSKIIITSAGASFGDKDFTEKALEAVGFKIKFRQVAIKPAKPFSFGLINKKIPVFMLPGNPVAFYTCLAVYVKPFINGHIRINSRMHKIKSVSSFEYIKKNKRKEFIPANTFYKDGTIYSEIFEKSGPATINVFGVMNSIISVPEDASGVHKGELLDTYLI
ncbi:MAG: molybdopterin molybdotransferase MoeA [Candidatus Acidulodesulfobacterium sp.]